MDSISKRYGGVRDINPTDKCKFCAVSSPFTDRARDILLRLYTYHIVLDHPASISAFMISFFIAQRYASAV